MTPQLAAWISIAGCFVSIVIGFALLKVKLDAISKLPDLYRKLEKKQAKHEIWLRILFDEAGKVPPEATD